MSNVVQSASIVWDGYDTVIGTFRNPVTSGNILYAALSILTTETAVIQTIFDTLGNQYTVLFPEVVYQTMGALVFAVKTQHGGPCTITVKLSHRVSMPDLRFAELTGVDMPPLVTSAVGTGLEIEATAFVSRDSLIIASVAADGGIASIGEGWSIFETSIEGNILASLPVQTTESISVSFSAFTGPASNWLVQLAAFPDSLPEIIRVLSGYRFANLLSPVLANDPSVSAAAAALDTEFLAVTAAIPQVIILANLDGQPDTVLDYLGLQLHVYAYSVDYPRETKLELIRQALPFNASIGTVATLKAIVSTIFLDCVIYEWWQTGGLPYTFTIALLEDADEATQLKIQAAVMYLKPKSRGFGGFVVQGTSSGQMYIGISAIHVGEYYVGARPLGFPPLWEPSMGPLKIN